MWRGTDSEGDESMPENEVAGKVGSNVVAGKPPAGRAGLLTAGGVLPIGLLLAGGGQCVLASSLCYRTVRNFF